MGGVDRCLNAITSCFILSQIWLNCLMLWMMVTHAKLQIWEGKNTITRLWGVNTFKDYFLWQFTNFMSNSNSPNSNTKYLECNDK
jgi:hypothetical protein